MGQLALERVDELSEDAELLILVRLGHDTRTVEHGLGGEDGGGRAHGQGDGVAGPRVDLVVIATLHQHDAGPERLVGKVGDDDMPHACPELREDRREQVVGQGPLGLHPLQPHGDRLGFPGADPDGQVALGVGLAKDDHVL